MPVATNTEDILKGMRHSNPEQKLRTIHELERVAGEVGTEKLADVLEELVSIVREGCAPQLNPLQRQLLRTIKALLTTPSALLHMAQENILLEGLSTWRVDSEQFKEEDEEEFLSILEILSSSDISTFYRQDPMTQLISICHNVISKRAVFSASFNSAIAILVNLCGANSLCILAIQDYKHFSDLFERLYAILKLEREEIRCTRTMILVSNLIIVIEVTGGRNFYQFAFSHAVSFCDRLLSAPGGKGVGGEWRDLAQFFFALTKKLESTILPELLKETQLINLYTDILKSTLEKLAKAKKHLQDKKLGGHILRLVTSLTSSPKLSEFVLQDINIAKSALAIIQAVEGAPNREIDNCFVYEAYFHILSQLSKLAPFSSKELGTIVEQILGSASLKVLATPLAMRYNTACYKIYSLAQSIPKLQAIFVDKVQKESANFLQLMGGALMDNEETISDERVIFVTEMFGLLADNSRAKPVLDILLRSLENRGTCSYLAAAILSEDQHLVTRALSIAATVAFSRDFLRDLSESLVKFRSGVVPLSRSPLSRSSLSPTAARGFKILEESLENVSLRVNADADTSFSSMISMFELRQRWTENEASALKDQLQASNTKFDELKSLISTQSKIIAAQAAELNLKQRQVHHLMRQLDKVNESAGANEKGIKKLAAEHATQLLYTNKRIEVANQEKEQALEKLSHADKEKALLNKQMLKEKQIAKQLEKDMAELKKQMKGKDDGTKELEKKVQKLERELARAAEEHNRLEHLLMKEKQTVDVIRGVLGNNGGLS